MRIIRNAYYKTAAKEKAGYTISIAIINEDGIPQVADGCWSKKSHGKKYLVLSGAGV